MRGGRRTNGGKEEKRDFSFFISRRLVVISRHSSRLGVDPRFSVISLRFAPKEREHPRSLTCLPSLSRSRSLVHPLVMSRSTSSSPCDKLVSLFLNRTSWMNDEETYPTYIRQLLLKKNSSLSSSRSLEGCLHLFQSMGNGSTEWPSMVHSRDDDRSFLAEHSSSLIIFILLITLVSLISILGNISLAKILFSKRDRLLQTDRIVLCLALSEIIPLSLYPFTFTFIFVSVQVNWVWC